MVRKYWCSEKLHRDGRIRLKQIGKRILKEVPGAAISADQDYREVGLTIDFCEDADPLPMTEIERIVDIFEAEGAVAKISSIHLTAGMATTTSFQ
jgi:hypothetical protein